MDRRAGVLTGVAAGAVWGLAFVLPSLAPGWSPEAVSAGRYLVYGAASALVATALRGRATSAWTLARRHWRPALLFAVTGNVGYYLLLVVALQHVGAPVSAAVIGTVPVAVAVAANLRDRTYRWRQLAAPLVLV